MYKRASRFFQRFVERNGVDLRGPSGTRPPRNWVEGGGSSVSRTTERGPAPSVPENGPLSEALTRRGPLVAARMRLDDSRGRLEQHVRAWAEKRRADNAGGSPEQVVLSEGDCELLSQHLEFYKALANGERQPATAAQHQFVGVTKGAFAPSTPHEVAFMKWRRIQAQQFERLVLGK